MQHFRSLFLKSINRLSCLAGLGFLLLLLAGVSCKSARYQQMPEGFTPLFNGKDLSGWHSSKTNHHGTVGDFSVEEGAIVMRQHPFGQGGILLTNQRYGDFELYLEFKGDAGTNGGIFFRSSESGTAYQVELAGDGEVGTGNLMGEMLHVTTRAEATALAKVWKKGDWNAIRLRVVGEAPQATLWVNGVQMWQVQAERNDLIADATDGMIALQLHWSATLQPVPGGRCCDYSWRPGAAHVYRNLAIKAL